MPKWNWVFLATALVMKSGQCFYSVSSRVSIIAKKYVKPETFRASVKHTIFSDTERVLCLSDLHVDHAENQQWLQDQCQLGVIGPRDLLILAGDVSHRYDRLRDCFRMLRATGCRILFCPGNHEAWCSSKSSNSPLSMTNSLTSTPIVDRVETSSYDKLRLVEDLCREEGVLVDPILLTNCSFPLWIVPLQSWYDGSLSIPGCEDLCTDFGGWPWNDFRACEWTHHPPDGTQGKIPKRLAEYFHEKNQEIIDFVKKNTKEKNTGIITMSHFLPNLQCLPDWKDLTSDSFQRHEWLNHGAPGTSAKFAKVAGSNELESQIRSIQSDIHIFGHSHRPKDFYLEGIRYVHNPLGNPRERLLYMVSPNVEFKLLWNTQHSGEVSCNQVIRLWEEEGGGLEALNERLELYGRQNKKKRINSTSKRIM